MTDPSDSPAIISTCAGPLAVNAQGSGPAMLLMPANGHAADDFDAIRLELSRMFRTYALDWPAMGVSPRSERVHSLSASLLSDAVLDVLDALHLDDAILVGHSVGGFASARLAARRPDRVRALLLCSPGGFVQMGAASRLFCAIKGTPWITRALEGGFARFHSKARNPHTAAMFERIDTMRVRPGYAEAVGSVWRSFARPESDLREEASAVRCPTLVISGLRDPVIPIHAGRTANRIIAGSKLMEMDTGHSCFVEDPQRFLDVTRSFLEALVTTREQRVTV